MALALTAKGFSKKLRDFANMTKKREYELYRSVFRHVAMSVRTGSGITGAPGQPVKTGKLLGSWRESGSLARRDKAIYSTLYYAPIIEYNTRGARLRSKVGGFHSVTITRLNYRLIVRYELAFVKQRIN